MNDKIGNNAIISDESDNTQNETLVIKIVSKRNNALFVR